MNTTTQTADIAGHAAPLPTGKAASDRAKMSGFFIFLIALLPVVPMPIAGGTPIAVTIIILMIGGLLMSGRKFRLDKFDWLIISIATALLFLEGFSAVYFNTPEDLNYFFGRAYWIALLVVATLVTNSEIQRGNFSFIPKTLFWGLIFLLCAMAVESAFFPKFAQGRNFGSFSLPWPRATGVPNSDGKLGTFLCICLGAFLFFRPKMPAWQYWCLGIGAIVGLGFTQSRSTLVALGLTFGIFWLYRSAGGRSASLWLMRIASLALGLVFVFVSFQGILSGLTGEGIFERNAMARVDHISYGLQVINSAPFLGAGADAITQYDQYSGIHNTMLAMSVKSGLVAGTLSIYLILFPIIHIHGSVKLFFANSAVCLGVLTEHMLYPGFINEFIVIAYLTAKVWWYREMFPEAPGADGHPVT